MCLSMVHSWQEVEVDVCIAHIVNSVFHSQLFFAGLPALLHSLLHHLQPGHSVSSTHWGDGGGVGGELEVLIWDFMVFESRR